MSASWKPGSARNLLILPSRSTTVTDSHGIEWVTDGFVIARRDCFRVLPARTTWPPGSKLRPHAVRKVLSRARAGLLPGIASVKGLAEFSNGTRARIVHAPASELKQLYTFIDANAWSAWYAMGLHPRLCSNGLLTWFGYVRGRETLAAVIACIYPYTGCAIDLAGAESADKTKKSSGSSRKRGTR